MSSGASDGAVAGTSETATDGAIGTVTDPATVAATVPAESAAGRVERTGADLLVDALVRAGCSVIFGVPGDTGVDFYDALSRRVDDVRHVLARDERHAAFMADCYARVTGGPGVVEVSSGGGCTYVVGGLGESFAASVPVVVVSSDIPSTSHGTGALTEIDQVKLFSAVTKWQVVASAAADLPRLVREAFAQATTGRPAPVVIIVPENVLDARVSADLGDVDELGSVASAQLPASRPVPEQVRLEAAADALARAQRPAVVAGSGVHWSAATESLAKLAEHAGIPLATTIHGRGTVADDNPWYLGVVGGNGGSTRANEYVRSADVVLLVGTRANATDTDSWTAPARSGPQVIQIDIDPQRAGRNFPGSISLEGDARATLDALVACLPRAEASRREVLLDWIDGRRPEPRVVTDESTEMDLLAAADVVEVLRQLVADRPHIVVADPGTPTPNVMDVWRVATPGRSVLAPRGHGPMGYAIPASVGAALASPESTVVAITADGSFAMCCGELETVARLGLPIIFVQLTNFSFGWIKMLQHLYMGERYFGVDPGPIDSVQVARASGLDATRVQSLAGLRSAVQAALDENKALYVDVPVRHLIDDVPPVTSWQAALAGDDRRPSY